MALPFGANAAFRTKMSGSESFPRGQRVLDGISGDRFEGRRLLAFSVLKSVWLEMPS
jgi:hypothetical protein